MFPAKPKSSTSGLSTCVFFLAATHRFCCFRFDWAGTHLVAKKVPGRKPQSFRQSHSATSSSSLSTSTSSNSSSASSSTSASTSNSCSSEVPKTEWVEGSDPPSDCPSSGGSRVTLSSKRTTAEYPPGNARWPWTSSVPTTGRWWRCHTATAEVQKRMFRRTGGRKALTWSAKTKNGCANHSQPNKANPLVSEPYVEQKPYLSTFKTLIPQYWICIPISKLYSPNTKYVFKFQSLIFQY